MLAWRGQPPTLCSHHCLTPLCNIIILPGPLMASPQVTWAPMVISPTQHFQMAPCCCSAACRLIPRQPLARAHFSISGWPPSAASLHVDMSQGQPFVRAHWSTARCPPLAAMLHVLAQGQPFARVHCSTAGCQVPAMCCTAARPHIPIAAIHTCPLKHGQVAGTCRTPACHVIPTAASLPQPLHA